MSNKKFFVFFLLLAMITVLAVGCGNDNGQNEGEANNNEVDAPVLSGAALVEKRCSECHNLDRVYRERDNWPEIINLMLSFSPELLDDEEYVQVVNYLEENYGN